MSGRCSSRPLATLTTCNGDLDADTHGVILSPAVPSPPPLPLSPPPNYTRETGCGPPRPSLPTPTPANPDLSVSLTPRCCTLHSRPNGLLPTLAGRSARLRTGLLVHESAPHPASILTWQIAVVLCARLLVAAQSLLPLLLSSILLVFPTAQQLTCVSLLDCGRTTATLPVLVGLLINLRSELIPLAHSLGSSEMRRIPRPADTLRFDVNLYFFDVRSCVLAEASPHATRHRPQPRPLCEQEQC